MYSKRVSKTMLLSAFLTGHQLLLAASIPLTSNETLSTSYTSCSVTFVSYTQASYDNVIQLMSYNSYDTLRIYAHSEKEMDVTNVNYVVDCKSESSQEYCYVDACGYYDSGKNQCLGKSCHVKATCGETYEIEANDNECDITELDVFTMTVTGEDDEKNDSNVTIANFIFSYDSNDYVISDGGNFT
eukprot:Pgem_evm1s610